MEKHALVVAFALTLPLALYGIPFAYAATNTSTYQVDSPVVKIIPGETIGATAPCNPGDVATGGGFNDLGAIGLYFGVSTGVDTNTNPTAWEVIAIDQTSSADTFISYAICQTPVTVAGVTVPEFGQLYLAIALGALVYFIVARRSASTSKIGPTPS
jgi:hypothetical protein